MEENKKQPVAQERTAADFFRRIFARGGLVVFAIAAAVFAVITFVLIQFVISPQDSKYQLVYEVEFPGMKTEQYPDGTRYFYEDSVAAENLQKIKADSAYNGAFASVDVATMSSLGHITLERVAVVEELSSTVVQRTGYEYKLTVSQKYFPDVVTAERFLTAVAETPIRRGAEIVKSLRLETYPTEFQASTTYLDKIGVLDRYRDDLLSRYDTLLKSRGDLYAVTLNGQSRTLGEYRLGAELTFTEKTINALKSELRTNSYVSDVAFASEYKAQLQSEKAANIALLNQYKEYQVTNSDAITTLIQRNARIDEELSMLETPTVSDEFDGKINAQLVALNEQTATYMSVLGEIYEMESIARVKSGMQVIGGVGTVVSLLASVAAALLGGFIAAWIASVIRKKKED